MKLKEDITVRSVIEYGEEAMKDFVYFVFFGLLVCVICWAVFCW